jgi:hypothetical protein
MENLKLCCKRMKVLLLPGMSFFCPNLGRGIYLQKHMYLTVSPVHAHPMVIFSHFSKSYNN